MTKAKTITTPSTEESKQSPETQDKPVVRAPDGQFLPGVSGNPNGRPKGKKNLITTLKQDLEIALREGLSVSDVQAVVKSMLAEALNGNVGAGKLILDKVMSNARIEEDEKDSSGGLRIIIENATLDVLQQNHNVIDVKPEITEEPQNV